MWARRGCEGGGTSLVKPLVKSPQLRCSHTTTGNPAYAALLCTDQMVVFTYRMQAQLASGLLPPQVCPCHYYSICITCGNNVPSGRQSTRCISTRTASIGLFLHLCNNIHLIRYPPFTYDADRPGYRWKRPLIALWCLLEASRTCLNEHCKRMLKKTRQVEKIPFILSGNLP